eukprot:292191-Amphidinium_carterae.1
MRSGDMASGVLCIPRLILRMALAVYGKDGPRAPLVPGGMHNFMLKFQQLKAALDLQDSPFN